MYLIICKRDIYNPIITIRQQCENFSLNIFIKVVPENGFLQPQHVAVENYFPGPGGIVSEEALDLSSDRLLMMMMINMWHVTENKDTSVNSVVPDGYSSICL
jgi:hypothetical protein